MTVFDPASDPIFGRLNDARDMLLRLHKLLLDGQRARHEKRHGVVASPHEFLQLAINDPAFDWLHRLSELVVQIDEVTEDKQTPITPQKAAALLNEARVLLTPVEHGEDFARHYFEAIQEQPEVGVIHGKVRKLLSL